jgi:hypothetical protein
MKISSQPTNILYQPINTTSKYSRMVTLPWSIFSTSQVWLKITETILITEWSIMNDRSFSAQLDYWMMLCQLILTILRKGSENYKMIWAIEQRMEAFLRISLSIYYIRIYKIRGEACTSVPIQLWIQSHNEILCTASVIFNYEPLKIKMWISTSQYLEEQIKPKPFGLM